MLLISVCAALILFVLFLGSLNSVFTVESPLGYQGQRQVLEKGVIIAFVAVLVIVSTLRFGFIDTYAYKIMYYSSRNNLEYVNSAPWDVEAGWLYVLYYLNFISKSPKLMLLLSALIINSAFVSVIYKYSSNVKLSLFLYFCLNYLDTNNGLRQFVAASIIILAFPLLQKKKFIWYAILVYLAYLLHNSAIFCLIVAFVAYGNPFNIKVKAFLVFSVFLILFPGVANGLLGDIFSENKYSDYLEISEGMGMGIARALVTGIIPGFLTVYYITKRKKQGVAISNEEAIILNFLLLNTAFVIMGSFMQYWARMGFYTAFACYAMLPKLFEEFFEDKPEMAAVKMVVYPCYFFFFCYNIYVNMGYGAMDSFVADFSWR